MNVYWWKKADKEWEESMQPVLEILEGIEGDDPVEWDSEFREIGEPE